MSNPDAQPTKYRWPWILLAAVLLGILLTVAWVLGAVKKVKRIKESTQQATLFPAPAHTPEDRAWTNEMVWIPAGSFQMGSEDGQPDEKPIHEVFVDGFWIDQTEVTNEQFEKFVKATGYVTVAEQKPDPNLYPGVPPEKLVPGSIVFKPPPGEVSLENHYLWWEYVPGANWRHPEGPSSTISGREKHPVVHVCWLDAVKYATWANKRLPTEAEWEYASRGGLARKPYSWGDEKVPDQKWRANIWQGRFPNENSVEDNFRGTAPVGSFAPNGYGLFDMAGNVWEWCQDWYLPDYYQNGPSKNPKGPDTSFDPNEPGVAKRVQRGGSYLCSDLYCMGYRPSARMKAAPDTGLSHSGFRCVRSN
jgi:formylglycine-generating enzyme